MINSYGFNIYVFCSFLLLCPQNQKNSSPQKKIKKTSVNDSDILPVVTVSVMLLSLYLQYWSVISSKKLSPVPLQFTTIDSDFSDYIWTTEQQAIINMLRLSFLDSADFQGQIEKQKELMKIHNPELPQGFLLFGPTGTGKTTYAKMVAKELKALFVTVDCSKIIDKFIGESAKNVNQVFEKIITEAKKSTKPIVVFFDEFESLGKERNSISSVFNTNIELMSILLQKFEEIRSYTNVILMVSTNLPEMLDQAIKRGQRLDVKLNFPLPNKMNRDKYIRSLKIVCDSDKKNGSTVHDFLLENTNDLGYADIKTIINNAKWNAIIDSSETLEITHFEKTIDELKLVNIKNSLTSKIVFSN